MNRILTAAVGGALVLGLGLASASAQAAPAKVTAHVVSTHGAVQQSHATSVRKANATDIAQGVAATASVYTCPGQTKLTNPYTGYTNDLLQGAFGWQESIDANGHPMARMNASTSVVFHNNANKGTTPIVFKESGWQSLSAGEYQQTVAQSNIQNTVSGQQQLGITIKTDGTTDTSRPSAFNWADVYHRNWGWRQWLTYNVNVAPAAIPELHFLLQVPNGSTNHYSPNFIRILPDGNCGGFYLE